MSLTARQGPPATRTAPAPLPLVVAGGAAGVAAAGFGFAALSVIALGAWMLDPSGAQEWSQMLEAASAAWLAGLGLAPTIGGVPLTLLPFGFALVSLLALAGAARWAAEASAVARMTEALAVAAAAALGFGAVAAVIAALSRTLSVSPLRAGVTGGACALIVVLFVVARRSGLLQRDRLPAAIRDTVAAAAVAVLVLVAVSGLLLVLAVVLHVDAITALLVELGPDVSGGLLLVVLTLAYVPTAIMWSMAYLLGPGISLGVGVAVSPFAETASASLPGFPMLAALPSQPPTAGAALPVLGVVAGALAGLALRRRGHVGLSGCGLTLAASGLVGIAVAAGAWLATGSLGTTTLVALGPSPALVAGAAALLTALGSTAVVAWPARGARG